MSAERQSYCTPAWLAEILPTFDLDPCSNERSHIRSLDRLLLDRGDNGLPGDLEPGAYIAAGELHRGAGSVFVNPPYDNTLAWVNHWKYNQFMFLLRWDPSTAWFETLIRETEYVWFPKRRRINFEPPPGVKVSSNAYPHAIYARGIPETDGMIEQGYRFRP